MQYNSSTTLETTGFLFPQIHLIPDDPRNRKKNEAIDYLVLTSVEATTKTITGAITATTLIAVSTIAITSGAVVDGISIEHGINVYPFGFCSANKHCGKNQITLDEDEKVQSITYGRSIIPYDRFNAYLNFICRLSFHTNKRVFGPFATGWCSELIYRVDIPSEMMLVDFFNQNLKTKLTPHHESGNNEPFFDGFTSEYIISEIYTSSGFLIYSNYFTSPLESSNINRNIFLR